MRRRILIFIAAFVAINISLAFIPADISIKLNGVISAGEWENAKEHPLAGGGTLMMQRESSVLFIALVAEKKSWAHVYLGSGDTIRVLHSSAALGEAIYVKKAEGWRPVQDFHWDLRDRVYNKEMENKQEAYYERHRWVANNNNTGDGKTFEFMIDLSAKTHLTFACLVLDDAANPHYYPKGLNDNTILPRLMEGYTPDSLQFSPGSWEKAR